jgi:hypothetical protein
MMTSEKQVTNLELSKRLKAAGIPQNNSLWYWQRQYFSAEKAGKAVTYSPISDEQEVYKLRLGSHGGGEFYAAYTVAELGEMLPYRIREQDDDYWLQIQKLKHGDWDIRYSTTDGKLHGQTDGIKQGGTEIEARGEMLLYLLYKGIIIPEDLKSDTEV